MANTVTISKRASLPPNTKPIERSGAGGRPSAVMRSLVAIESIAPVVAATASTTATDGSVPASIVQSASAPITQASARRSRTPSRSAPAGLARTWSLAISPSTPSSEPA